MARRRIVIHDFEDIADRFRETLVLGNGASIALSPAFSYPSLLEHARGEGLIPPSVQAVFDHFGTSDFELIMRVLRHAFHVNRALHVDEEQTEAAYRSLKDALIRAVRDIHIEHDDVAPHIPAITDFMRRFDLVLSLNYDLTVYWAMLRGNEALGLRWFKDCWVGGEFDGDWERFWEPMRPAQGATLVFYPHGNLILATGLTGGEVKLAVNTPYGTILNRVIRAWEEGDQLPLFVSEGETRQKEDAISRSGYLSTVYNDVMTQLGPSIVIYGWAMADNDDHILRRVCSSRTERIAISVHNPGRDANEIEVECAQKQLKIQQHNPAAEVFFFDATSAGCWLHPAPENER